jgi:hypothetical protein
MSYNIKEKDCEQSDGDDGDWILSYTDKKRKNRKNCHTKIQNVLSQISSMEGIFPESNNTLKLTRSQLKNLIKEEMKENLSSHQSELSYSKTNPPESKKALQRSYWKAHRGPAARADIASQVAGMEAPEADQRTLGDILPIPRDEWENYSAVSDGDVPSEKAAYLYDLSYDIAHGREGSDLSHNDIERIGELVYDQFGFDWVQMVVGHGDGQPSISEAQHKVKITRSQLKSLIKEVMLRENDSWNEAEAERSRERIMDTAHNIMKVGKSSDDLFSIIVNVLQHVDRKEISGLHAHFENLANKQESENVLQQSDPEGYDDGSSDLDDPDLSQL